MRAAYGSSSRRVTKPLRTSAKFVRFLVNAILMALTFLSPAQVGPGGLLIQGDRTIRESVTSTAPLVEIASGQSHTLGLRADGTIVAWGSNVFGQCNVPAGLLGVAHVYAGKNHSILLMKDGTVRCFGLNNNGQCVPPAGLTGVIQVAGGSTHTVALKSDGTVICWGDHNFNMCNVPAGLTGVAQVAAGEMHTIVRKSNGALVGWGDGNYGQNAPPAGVNNFVELSSSMFHNIAIRADGTVAAWGSNFSGESTVPSGLTGITHVAAGYIHNVAQRADGTIACWGNNGFGQLNAPATQFKQISACFYDSGGLTMDGHFVGWGFGQYGECSEPYRIANLSRVVAGSNHIAFFRNDNTVGSWGSTNKAQTAQITTNGKVVEISAGVNHTAVLQKNPGKAFYAGDNQFGQLSNLGDAEVIDHLWAAGNDTFAHYKSGGLSSAGNNDWNQRSVINGLQNAVQITGGLYHNLLLKPDGTLVAAGDNTYGRATVPAGLSEIVQIASSNYHNLALKADGTVRAWGWNGDGQSSPPTGLTNVSQIAAGDIFSLALKADGTVAGWGGNGNGQLAFPIGLTGISQVGAGASFSALVPRLGFTVAPYMVIGGDAATGTVTLTAPAPIGGTQVLLTSDNSAAMPPAVITIPAGATSMNFPIPTAVSTTTAQVTISAMLDGFTQNSLLTVTPAPFTLTLNNVAPIGGSTGLVKGTITLPNPAPVGGTVFTLASSDPAATVPATITVPATKSTFTFLISHSQVTAVKTLDISATNGGVTRAVTLKLNPFQIIQFVLGSPNIIGGYNIAATVTLNAIPATDVSIPLTSSVASAIPTPGFILVPAGVKTATGPVATSAVTTATSLTLSATYNNTRTAALKVFPALASLKSATTTWFGNSALAFTLTLQTGAPVGGLVVDVAGTSCSAPLTVTVPEGETALTFSVIADDLSASGSGTVTASTVNCFVKATKAILPNIVAAISSDNLSFKGGSSTVVTLTVSLKDVVAVDTEVSIVSSLPGVASAPSTVIVPAGESSISFPLPHFATTKAKPVRISATRLGVTKNVNLTVNP